MLFTFLYGISKLPYAENLTKETSLRKMPRMNLRAITKIIPFVLLASGLSGCVGSNPLTDTSNNSDPSHWVTKSWVEGERPSKKPSKLAKQKATPTWLTEKLDTVPTTTTPSIPLVSSGNLWDNLPYGYQLPDIGDSSQVQAQISWFMSHQGYLNRTANRSAPYLHYIYQQVQRRHLPSELVMLPIIESAYNPFTSSPRGAAGLWQMMPGTATTWGIKQNWWYDGRRDIFASTNAALDYLTYLQSYFNGNWLLAIAAYNCGEGTVQAAIRHNTRLGKATDFWSLPLPQETRAYVPRLLALAKIIKHRGTYPINLPTIEDKPYLTQVDVGSQIDLSHAAQLAGMEMQELRQLNPGYSRSATDPSGTHTLILPINKVDDFKQKLALLPRVERVSYQSYKAKHVESLSTIAMHFDTTAAKLRELNHLKFNYVKAGRTLLVPVTALAVSHGEEGQSAVATNEPVIVTEGNENPDLKAPDIQSTLAQASASTQEQTPEVTKDTVTVEPASSEKISDTVVRSRHHKIKKGETLYMVATRYGTTAQQLMKLNKLKSTHLKPGTTLQIPSTHLVVNKAPKTKVASRTSKPSVKMASARHTKGSKVYYQVKAKDTVFSIAKRHNVDVSMLKKANKLSSNASIHPGQRLVIPTA